MDHRTRVPADLSALLMRSGVSVSRIEDISPLSVAAYPRRTYRIELEDGATVKGRIVRDAGVTSRMERWLPLLPRERFSTLLSTFGVATLESWCSGSPCHDADGATAETAGALLGELHALLPQESIRSDAPRFSKWYGELEGWLGALRDGGYLPDRVADRALDRIRDLRPRSSTWALGHGDFCLDNLVRGDRGLCCIDNVSVEPGILESDLAHTFYRWPMETERRKRFLAGYRRDAVPTHFLEHEDFWMIAATLRAAEFRMRARTGGVEVPLRIAMRHVDSAEELEQIDS